MHDNDDNIKARAREMADHHDVAAFAVGSKQLPRTVHFEVSTCVGFGVLKAIKRKAAKTWLEFDSSSGQTNRHKQTSTPTIAKSQTREKSRRFGDPGSTQPPPPPRRGMRRLTQVRGACSPAGSSRTACPFAPRGPASRSSFGLGGSARARHNRAGYHTADRTTRPKLFYSTDMWRSLLLQPQRREP